MPTKPTKIKPDAAGICRFHESLGCPDSEKTSCWRCGWNPDNGVRERRVAAAMREYRLKLRTGEIRPPW